MRKAFLLLTFLILTIRLNAQEIEWQNTMGGNGEEKLTSLIKTTDGGFLLCGTTNSPISGDITQSTYNLEDYCVFKTDSLGNVQWQKTFGSNGSDILTCVIQTNDGGYLLGGYSPSAAQGNKTENAIGEWDYWIVKIDANGIIEWDNTIGGIFDDKLHSILQTADGGYMLGGLSESNISGDKTENSKGGYDYWIVKIDSVGNIIWDKTIGANLADHCYELIPSLDGEYYLGGISNSPISGDKTEQSFGVDYWIVKIDSIGDIKWQNTLVGSGDVNLSSLIETADGDLVLGGYSVSYADYNVVKSDTSGNIQWQRNYRGNWDDRLRSLIETLDGGFMLAGYSNSNISHDKTENSWPSQNFWIIKTDYFGNIEWQNTLGGIPGAEWLSSVVQTSDGGYLLGGYMGGYTTSTISGDITENSNGGNDFWIVKIIDNYNQIQGKTFADLNSNQIQEQGDPDIPYHKITETNTNRFAFSQASGFYSVAVLDTGNFEVAPVYLNLYNPVPLVHPGNFTAFQQIDSLNDFAFQPTGTFNDLCLTLTPTGQFRSGFNASYSLNYSNQGNTTLIPTIVFYPDTNVSFVSASITPTTVTSDSVIFVLTTLTPFQSGQISITVSVDLGLPIGTLVNSGAMILPIANDANPGCNSSFWEVLTTGSFDPNDILVNRSFIYDYEMPSPPDLEYIIRFQNTGNDTAFTVKILNPIDTTRLDLSTLDIVSTSHDADVRFVYHERNLEFVMNNILLPDSNTNEPMSHGFVRYRIKPKTTVAVGDSIQNFAAIYFDFNSPVITNTAVTHIIIPTGIYSQAAFGSQPTIFPNPVNNELTIQFNSTLSQSVTIQLYNIYVQKVKELFSDVVETGNWMRKFDMSNLSQGVYFIKIDSGISSIHKVIKL